MRSYQLRKPTHDLVHNDITYAEVRCGKGEGSTAVKLLSTGEVQRSCSFSLDCDLLMGRWQEGLFYLFGHDADHIPFQAKLIGRF
jgi:hypothetical protein